MRNFIIVFIIVLCISCAYTGMPNSPSPMGVGVSNTTVIDENLASQKSDAYVGDLRLVDIDRTMRGATNVHDSKDGVRAEMPQYTRFF